jgi:hypothetical protein
MTSRLRWCSPLALGLLALALSSGCGPSSTTSTDSTALPAEAEREEQLAQREAAIEEREAELDAREAEQEAAPMPRPAPVQQAPRHSTTSGSSSSAAAKPQASPVHQAPRAPVMVDLPAGSELSLELLSDLSSGTSTVGERFRARVVSNVMSGDAVAIPAGAEVEGSVTEVVPLKKIGGQPQIVLGFDKLELASGSSYPIRASFHGAGKKQGGRDAAKIAGGAAAGAILGHQIDDDKGKLIGAVVGGAIGTAAAAKTGKEIDLPAGTALAIQLEDAISVPVGS